MYNETNLKVSQKNQQIVEAIIDFQSDGDHAGQTPRWSRYRVIFPDGTIYESDSKNELHDFIKLVAKAEYEKQLDIAIAKDMGEEVELVEQPEVVEPKKMTVDEEIAALTDFEFYVRAVEGYAKQLAAGGINGSEVPRVAQRMIRHNLVRHGSFNIEYMEHVRTITKANVIDWGGLSNVFRMATRGVREYQKEVR